MNEPIDLENINTYPSELVCLVKNHISEIKWVYENAEDEHYYETFRYDAYFDYKPLIIAAEKILDKYELIGYHITRTVDIEEIKNEGLKILNLSEYLARMHRIFHEYSFLSTSKIDECIKYLKGKIYYEECRQNNLSLFAPMSEFLLYEKDGGYLMMYGRTVGGEIASQSLDDCTFLNTIGKTYVVKFVYPFSSLVIEGEYPKEYVTIQIIMFTLQHILNGKLDGRARMCAQVTESIPSDKIIKIYPKDEIDNIFHME